jgi:CHAT domain-containing protein
MRFPYKSLLILALSCYSIPSFAQTRFETVSKVFKIEAIYADEKTKKDNSCILYFAATKGTKVDLGTPAAIYTENPDGDYALQVASGYIIRDTLGYIYLYVTTTKDITADTNYTVKEGDLAVTNIQVPQRPDKNIFYELELQGITFYKRDNSALWEFSSIVNRTDKKFTDSLVNECIKECVKAYQRETTSSSPDTTYSVVATAGRNKNKSVLDIFKKPGARDILPFLTYVKDIYTLYRGKPYYFESVLKRWMYSYNSRYSHGEMLDTLLSYGTTTKKFHDFVASNKEQIVESQFVYNWSFAAMGKEDDNRQALADSILLVTYSVSKLVDDDFSKALHFLAQAQIAQDRGKYKEAIAFCDSGLKYARPQLNGFYAVEFHIKKGYLYQKLKQVPDAEASYRKACAIAADASTNLNGSTKESTLGRGYNALGDLFDKSDEYAKATEAYRSSIDHYIKDGSYASLNTAASTQNSLAGIYKRQGAYADASSSYSELLETYLKVNNVKKAAETYDNISYIQFQQGQYRESINSRRSAQRVYTMLYLYGDAALDYSNIGQAYWNLGLYDSAILSHTVGLEYGKLGNDLSRQAYSWGKLGKLYGLIGEKSKAFTALDSSAYYYQLANDNEGLVTNLVEIGDVYNTDKQYQKAYEYYSRAHNVNLKQGNKSSIIETYFKLGSAAYGYDTALSRKNYLSCYNMSKEIDDRSNLLYSSLNLGLLATRNYDYNTSEKYFDEGVRLSIAENSKSNEAYAYEYIGYGKLQKLELEDAFNSFKKAMIIYDSLGEKSKIPGLLTNLGNSLQSKGEFDEAIKYYDRSKAYAYEIKNLAEVGNVLQYLSFAYILSGEPQKSLQAADSSLIIYKELQNNWQVANSYLTLGNSYNGMSDYQKAVRYYTMSDSLYIIEKDVWASGTCMNNIGNVYYHQADYQNAIKYFLEADKRYNTIKVMNESIMLTRVNIGETYYAMKKFDDAKKYLLDAYKTASEKSVIRIYTGAAIVLAKIAIDENKFAEAKKYLDNANAPAYKLKEANKIIELHLSYGRLAAKQGNNEEGIRQFRTAVDYCRKTQTDKYLWEGLYELGLSFYNHESYDSAIAIFKEAVDVVETGASKLFGGTEAKKIYSADEKKVDLYNKLVASLAKLKKTEEALYYADKSNSQAIKEKLEQSGIITSDKEKTEALKKGSELLQKQTAIGQSLAKEKAKPEKERNDQLIASLESIRKVAEEDYLNFINELVVKYPEMQSYFTKTNPADFRNYIEYIPDSTLVVLYVINDKQLYIFTVTSHETAIKVVELKDDINKHAMRLLGIIQNPENATGTGAIQVRSTIPPKGGIKGDFKTESSLLYDLLITPIADQLKDKKSLCIIPNAALCRIPFATLGKTDETNRFHFLVEDFGIFYTNKMDIFSKPFKKSNISASFVAFGNPDKSLPGATMEVNNIKDLYPNATVYLEQDATEEKAKTAMKSSKYIHFATHGILNNEDFAQSFLLMNKDATNDGRFTLSEINGLIKDETDMIFLSACEMAIPKDLGKGWDISILNALLINRVRTVAGGLWQVPDEATMEMVDVFYKNVKTMSRSEALRQAQATISKNPKYQHPFFWAAFVMYGDWR